jgi:hypothetical protein
VGAVAAMADRNTLCPSLCVETPNPNHPPTLEARSREDVQRGIRAEGFYLCCTCFVVSDRMSKFTYSYILIPLSFGAME